MTEKIYVGINDKRIELKGKDLEAFLAQKELDTEANSLLKAAELERQKAKESGMLKLKSLGLTDFEIAVLLGN